jgi:hypothetical protein
MEGSRSIGFLDRTNGLLMLILVVVGLLSTLFVVRPQRPSPFAAGSGYGVGFGSASIMVTSGDVTTKTRATGPKRQPVDEGERQEPAAEGAR